jgi:hypothetical protein
MMRRRLNAAQRSRRRLNSEECPLLLSRVGGKSRAPVRHLGLLKQFLGYMEVLLTRASHCGPQLSASY